MSNDHVHPIFQPILAGIAPETVECPRSPSKRHEYETRRDWMGDPSIPNGTTSWEVQRCRWCSRELTQCDCGVWFDPVGDDGEDHDHCASCRQNEAEAAYERHMERSMEDPPLSLNEQCQLAWEEKRRLK